MHRAIGLLFATFAFAAEPNEKAHQLLDEAAATVSSTTLDIHILSLMHLGRMYQYYDKPKSIDFFRQAFAATAGASEESKDALQGEIVKNLADVSLPEAMEQLRGMAQPATNLEGNTSAIDRVVSMLLAKNEFDKAAEVIGLVPANAVYPFRSASTVFESLPENDPRRVLVFTRATTAYQTMPAPEFTEMLHTHWKKLPREVADSALNAVMNAILVKKDDSISFNGDEADDNGKMIMRNRRLTELGWMYQVLKGLDAKRAQQLLATNVEIKSAVAQPLPEKKPQDPNSKPSTEPSDDDGLYPPLSFIKGIDLENMSDRIAKWAIAEKRGTEAIALAEKDLPQALSKIGDLPYPVLKAMVTCNLSRNFSRKNHSASNPLLDKCMTAISDIKDPEDLSGSLLLAAESAHILKQQDKAVELLKKAFVAAAEAYIAEAGAEKRNKALREYWPSVQMCKIAAYSAAQILKEEAADLLDHVREPDMSVMMRVELARALMKDQNNSRSMSFRF